MSRRPIIVLRPRPLKPAALRPPQCACHLICFAARLALSCCLLRSQWCVCLLQRVWVLHVRLRPSLPVPGTQPGAVTQCRVVGQSIAEDSAVTDASARAGRLACWAPQPKEIQEIKDFLLTARRKDARCACPARVLALARACGRCQRPARSAAVFGLSAQLSAPAAAVSCRRLLGRVPKAERATPWRRRVGSLGLGLRRSRA